VLNVLVLRSRSEIFVSYRALDASSNNGGSVARLYPGGRFHGITFEELLGLGSDHHEFLADARDRGLEGTPPSYASERDRLLADFKMTLFMYEAGAYTALEVLAIARATLNSEHSPL
jgi:hypothetical protein